MLERFQEENPGCARLLNRAIQHSAHFRPLRVVCEEAIFLPLDVAWCRQVRLLGRRLQRHGARRAQLHGRCQIQLNPSSRFRSSFPSPPKRTTSSSVPASRCISLTHAPARMRDNFDGRRWPSSSISRRPVWRYTMVMVTRARPSRGCPNHRAHRTFHARSATCAQLRASSPPVCRLGTSAGDVPLATTTTNCGTAKAPDVDFFTWLPVGVNYNKPARGSVSLI